MLSSKVIKRLLGLSAFLGFSWWFWTPIFDHAKIGAQRQICQQNLKAIAFACAQYRRDSDGFFPAISRGETGWADALQPYAKSWAIFQCPAARKTALTRRTDYFYNARLAHLRSVRLPAQVILFGDGDDNRGANASLTELPFDWKADDDSPAQRHFKFGSYAFADGHVKLLRPGKVVTVAPSTDDSDWKFTFAVR